MAAPGGPVAEGGVDAADGQDVVDLFQPGLGRELGRVHDQFHARKTGVPPDARDKLQGEVEEAACGEQDLWTGLAGNVFAHVIYIMAGRENGKQ
ncbi:hypothetical protein JCM14722_16560 [Pseudodesulfovibrio portus]|uniref:Uncharacterized protein n=1 Tax=Pseudodesulfovibrio portus TaxID=231439 RepID=A0ABM8ARR8_9BACT|nr:hypothetical protein JCM14722_16560 [Pseudodesulfovibrio portus]